MNIVFDDFTTYFDSMESPDDGKIWGGGGKFSPTSHGIARYRKFYEIAQFLQIGLFFPTGLFFLNRITAISSARLPLFHRLCLLFPQVGCRVEMKNSFPGT